MATRTWKGGATAVTQVHSFTVALTWAVADTLTTTLTLEDGSTTQAVQSTATGSTIETQVRDVHLTDLQNSTLTEFVKITWTADSTDKIKGTAKVSGIPFVSAATESTAGDGTYTRGVSTANVGPNDVDSSANYVNGTKTANTDTLIIAPHPTDLDAQGRPVSHDMLYGLSQSAISPAAVRRAGSYLGVIGSNADGYYLTFSTITLAILDCQADTWLKATVELTTLRVIGGHNSVNMLHVGDDIPLCYIMGPRVLGTVTIRDGSDLDNLWCNIPNGRLVTPNNPANTNVWEIMAGNVTIKDGLSSGTPTLNLSGGVVEHFGNGGWTTINNRGAQFFYNGSGLIANLNQYEGLTSFDRSVVEAVTVSNSNTYGGLLTAENGLNNVTWTNDRIQHQAGLVRAETGVTITKS